MTDSPRVQLVSSKIPSGIHRTWTSAEITDSPWAFYVPDGSKVRERNGNLWGSDYPVVGLFWPRAYYQVFLLMKPGGTEYYCNLIAPVEWEAESREVRFVDLDLDVMVDQNGPQVLDQNEFEERRALYPDAWVRGVTLAVPVLQRWATTRTGPFSEATNARWWAWIDDRHRPER